MSVLREQNKQIDKPIYKKPIPTKVILHNVYRVDEDFKNAMVYFRDVDDHIVGSIPMKGGNGYTLDDNEPRFSCEPQQPGLARTKCCEGMLYRARCINCLQWYTYDVLKELYDDEKLDKMMGPRPSDFKSDVVSVGGPIEPVEDDGFINLFEDDLFPEKELECVCVMTANGPVEDDRCPYHKSRRKK